MRPAGVPEEKPLCSPAPEKLANSTPPRVVRMEAHGRTVQAAKATTATDGEGNTKNDAAQEAELQRLIQKCNKERASRFKTSAVRVPQPAATAAVTERA